MHASDDASDYASDDSFEAGLRAKALLPVAPADPRGDDDLSAPPADGLEYLRRVRAEAAEVPDVMVAATRIVVTPERSSALAGANGPSVTATLSRRFAPAPAHAVANENWTRAFLADFSDHRAAVQRAAARAGGVDRDLAAGSGAWDPDEEDGTPRRGPPGGGDGGAALAEASEAALAAMDDEAYDAREDARGDDSERRAIPDASLAPRLAAVAAADDVCAAATLRRHADAMASHLSPRAETKTEGDENGDAKKPRLSALRAAWFFALASRVGLPLDADTAASLRAAARAMADARAATETATDPTLPRLQVCLAVAGKYFGQGDGDE